MANSLFESAREAERRAIAITDMVHGGSWMVRPRRPRQQRKRKQSPCWQAWTARRRQRAPHSPDMATGPAAPPAYSPLRGWSRSATLMCSAVLSGWSLSRNGVKLAAAARTASPPAPAGACSPGPPRSRAPRRLSPVQCERVPAAPAVVTVECRQVDAAAGVHLDQVVGQLHRYAIGFGDFVATSNSKSKASFICVRISSEIAGSCGEITTSSAPRA